MGRDGISRNRTCIVVGHGKGRLAARRVERGESAVGSSQEAVISQSRATKIVSRNSTCGVDAESERAQEGADVRSIESGHGAVGGAKEAVNQVTRINVVSRNRARRVDALGEGALRVACAGAWGVERGESSCASSRGKAQSQAAEGQAKRQRP